MSKDIVSLQQELAIAKQQSEIFELRSKLEKLQAEKTSRLEDSLFSPKLFQHYTMVAEAMADSDLVPTAYRKKPKDVFIAIAQGYQVGLSVEQALQDIAVINGRPCLWGDGLLALVLNHQECEYIQETPIVNDGNVIGYSCAVKRKGHPVHEQVFTLQDANTAGLLKKQGPWQQYPKRMLQVRARSLAIRDKFADALRGLRVAEVERDDSDSIIDIKVEEIKQETQTEKLKKALAKKNEKQQRALQPSKMEDNQNVEVSQPENVDHLPKNEDIPKCNQEQINKICILLDEKSFDEARLNKALHYFGVESLQDLTSASADEFIRQLMKM